MTTNACLYFYECSKCQLLLRPISRGAGYPSNPG
ncbi:hypothetical protein [Spirosoma linguale]